MKFLELFTEEDRKEYNGEVRIFRDTVLITGYLNSNGDFVELFADGAPGRSHLLAGSPILNVPTEDLELINLITRKTWVVVAYIGDNQATFGSSVKVYGPFATKAEARDSVDYSDTEILELENE